LDQQTITFILLPIVLSSDIHKQIQFHFSFQLSIRPISTLGWFLWSILRIYELARKSISAHIRASEVSRHTNLQTIPKPDTIPDSRNFPMDQQTAHSLQRPRRRKGTPLTVPVSY
jgi:hypothetical protein